MRYLFTNQPDTDIDKQIDAVLKSMTEYGVDSEEYPKLMGHLAKLHEIKTQVRRSPVSRDTIALIAGNLMGLLLIVAYEQKHVLTSKAWSQTIKPRT